MTSAKPSNRNYPKTREMWKTLTAPAQAKWTSVWANDSFSLSDTIASVFLINMWLSQNFFFFPPKITNFQTGDNWTWAQSYIPHVIMNMRWICKTQSKDHVTQGRACKYLSKNRVCVPVAQHLRRTLCECFQQEQVRRWTVPTTKPKDKRSLQTCNW